MVVRNELFALDSDLINNYYLISSGRLTHLANAQASQCLEHVRIEIELRHTWSGNSKLETIKWLKMSMKILFIQMVLRLPGKYDRIKS